MKGVLDKKKFLNDLFGQLMMNENIDQLDWEIITTTLDSNLDPSSVKVRVFYTDGGAFNEPPNLKPHNAFFSVLNESGDLLHLDNSLGGTSNHVAEYSGIRWIIENIRYRPLKIVTDSKIGIVWATKGGKSSYGTVKPLNLDEVDLVHQVGNLADKWNAKNYSPKKSPEFYRKRWILSQKSKT